MSRPVLTPRSLLWLAGAATAGSLLALPAALAWGFIHPPRRLHRRTPRTALGLDYERHRIPSAPNLTISLWYVPHPYPRGVAILCHGYFGNRETLLPYLEFLHPAGFAAVLFDFRAHGWSDGKRITFGAPHGEPNDLRAVLRWIDHRPELAPLPRVLVGESMGAAVALLVAAQDPTIRAVVADSAYARFDSAVAGRLRLAFGETLGKILTPPARRIGERLIGTACDRIAPEEAIRRIAPRPVFLIHGTQDRLIVPENVHRLTHAAGENARTWIVEGARHVQSVHVAPDYGARVVAFLDQALDAPVQLWDRQISHTPPEQTRAPAR